MDKEFAVVKDGVMVNKVLAKDGFTLKDHELIELAPEDDVDMGDTRVSDAWVKAPENIPVPPTALELWNKDMRAIRLNDDLESIIDVLDQAQRDTLDPDLLQRYNDKKTLKANKP